MVKSKDKGSRWERDAVKILNDSYYGTWKRVPGSGAFGTILEIDEERELAVVSVYMIVATVLYNRQYLVYSDKDSAFKFEQIVQE